MAITIHPGFSLDEHKLDPYVVLWRIMICYLDKIADDYAIKRFTFCDPYGEYYFNKDLCIKLQQEIPVVIELVAKKLFPDPKQVAPLEYDDEDKPYLSYDDVTEFLINLGKVIEVALKDGTGIIVIGD